MKIENLQKISPLFARLWANTSSETHEPLLVMSPSQPPVYLPTDWQSTAMPNNIDDCLALLRQQKRVGLLRGIWYELGLYGDALYSATAFSDLADFLLQSALTMARNLIQPRFGVLEALDFSIIGLGKLGGQELNAGSDVDLLFIWNIDDTEQRSSGGRKSVAANEYTQQLSKILIRLIGENTADGQVWPVDMRLRPGGDAAAISLSLDVTLDYYQNYGQTWERAMLIKARCVAGDIDVASNFLEGLQPFIYRRYLDYTTVHALADMKGRIDRQAGKCGSVISEGFDVKRGCGGIREIEFLVQAGLLLHAGRKQHLQSHNCMQALDALCKAGFIADDAAQILKNSYRFWRKVEHAVQLRTGEQTQKLPTDFINYLQLSCQLENVMTQMQTHAEQVHSLFAASFNDVQQQQNEIPNINTNIFSKQDKLLIEQAISDVENFLHRSLLAERCVPKVRAILAEAMQSWNNDSNGVQAVRSFAALLRQIGGRATWIDLLAHNKGVRSWLIDILAASQYVATHVVQNPSWLEWPLEHERGTQRIATIIAQIQAINVSDEQQALADLGRFCDQGRLTCAISIASDESDPLTIGSWLADIADNAVKKALLLVLAQYSLPNDFPLIVLALGKHGSREMGLVSDLDLVFVLVTDNPMDNLNNERNICRNIREWAQRVGRRLIQHLTLQSPYGAGYELDARLRPSGHSGVLVTTLQGFINYQDKEAQTWEHQALCRARAIGLSQHACEKLMSIVQKILSLPRNVEELAHDVLEMRNKMLAHLGSHDATIINLKHNSGGLVDIEFLAQFCRLHFGGTHKRSVDILSDQQYLPNDWHDDMAWLAQTYLEYRAMENVLRAQLWQSIGKLPTDNNNTVWETMRRHTNIQNVSELQQRMQRVHNIFCQRLCIYDSNNITNKLLKE
ncbi:MAG: bifunctional [glutamate--ammonia ligase]-adenylyl-L-tyrosine phosphorylase/[glutamate--ammonia-ligase] adenylyltransferase [Mariprofundales bacterium]